MKASATKHLRQSWPALTPVACMLWVWLSALAFPCSRGWGCTMQAWDYFSSDGSSVIWASYSFRSTVTAPLTVTLATYNASTKATVAVYIDGVLVGTQSATGGTEIFNSNTVSAGLHSVIVRAVDGAFSLTSVDVK